MLLIRLSGTLVPMSSRNSAGGPASWADSSPATAKVLASSGRIDIQDTPLALAIWFNALEARKVAGFASLDRQFEPGLRRQIPRRDLNLRVVMSPVRDINVDLIQPGTARRQAGVLNQ